MPSAVAPREVRTVQVRRIRPEEWAGHRELRLRALSCDPLAFGSTLTREREFPDDLWKERTARGASSTESALFVAAAGPTGLVGMASVVFFEGRWHLFGMWVEPNYRGQGVGGRLLDAGTAWLRTVAPGQPLHLEVNPKQGGAVRLYEGRRFRRTGASAPLGHAEGETTVSMVLDPS
jgi:ribosomal protein S18 acetylase RimI-like enzyme